MFESWSFTFSTCCETGSSNLKWTVEGWPVEYCSKGQKQSSLETVCLGRKGMPTILMVTKYDLKKIYKNQHKDSMKSCSCWTHCCYGHKKKVLFIYFFFFFTPGNNYLHFLLLESALQWVTWPTVSSKATSCFDSKHRCLHHFTHLERSTASCVRSAEQKALSLQPGDRCLCKV